MTINEIIHIITPMITDALDDAEAYASAGDVSTLSAAKAYTDTAVAGVSSTALQGVAIPTDNPGAHSSGRWWFAVAPGTYTNFAGIVISSGEFVAIVDNGTTYLKVLIPDRYGLIALDSIFASVNLCPSILASPSRWSTSTGAFLTTASYVATPKIAVLPSTVYNISGYGTRNDVIAYDASNVFIANLTVSDATGARNGKRFTTPSNCAFIACNLTNTGETGFAAAFQLGIGAYIKPFQSPASVTKHWLLPSAMEGALTINTYVGKNLIAPSYIAVGMSLNSSFAAFANANFTTAVVPVLPSTQYTISGWRCNKSAKRIRFEDAAGNSVGTFDGTSVDPGQTYTFTTPASTAYIYFGVKHSVDTSAVYDFIMLALGTESTYIPYSSDTRATQIGGFEMQASRLSTNAMMGDYRVANLNDLTNIIRTVNVYNMTKLLVFGCSYTEGFYSIINKGWVNKLAQFLKVPVFNQGVSGNRLIDELNRFQQNVLKLATQPQNLIGQYIWIGNIGNEELLDFDYPLDLYLKSLRSFIEFARAQGAVVIISEDHKVLAQPMIQAGLEQIAKDNQCIYIPTGVYGELVMTQNVPTQFWYGHPGVRNNSHQFLTQLDALNKFIGNPYTAIKAFSKRSGFTMPGSPTVTDINTLNFFSEHGIARKWQCLNVGEFAFSEATSAPDYYDNLTPNVYQPNVIAINNAYSAMTTGTAMSFTDYGLIRGTIGTVNPTYVKMKLKMTDLPYAFYVKNGKSSAGFEDTSPNNCCFTISKAVYDGLTNVPGDLYTSPAVTGTSPTNQLEYTGKVFSPLLNSYLMCFKHNGAATKVSGTANNLSKVSGSGATTIAYTKFDSNLAYSYGFFSQFNQPDGGFELFAASYESGYKVITITDQKYLDYDTMSVIIYYSGGAFTVSDIQLEYAGGYPKDAPNTRLDYKYPSATGAELMPHTSINSTHDGFTLSSGASCIQHTTYVHNPPIAGVSPYLLSIPFSLTNGLSEATSEYAEATITLPASDTDYRTLLVKVVAESFRKVYTPGGSNTAMTTTTREVTPDSYDYGRMVLRVINPAGGSVPAKKLIGQGFAFRNYEVLVPPGVTSLTLRFEQDTSEIISANYYNHNCPLLIGYVSAKIV